MVTTVCNETLTDLCPGSMTGKPENRFVIQLRAFTESRLSCKGRPARTCLMQAKRGAAAAETGLNVQGCRGVAMSEVQIASDRVNNPVTEGQDSTRLQQQNTANESPASEASQHHSTTPGRQQFPIVYLLVLMVACAGWRFSGNLYLTPEQGPGYALGIIGALLMLMLLLYPLRKHARWTRGLGPVRYWFRSHMLMGVIGPVCILFHCNYQLGSTNGNIALFSMLLVAGSGLVGRYFYTRIHYGLYGRKADLVHLGSDAAMARMDLKPVFDVMPGMKTRLAGLEARAMSTQRGFLSCLANVLVVNMMSRWCWYASLAELRKYFFSGSRRENLTRKQRRYYYRKIRHYLSDYLYTVRKVAGFSFFEKLFSLWHVLHLPLFVMLLITGTVHVYAVHMY